MGHAEQRKYIKITLTKYQDIKTIVFNHPKIAGITPPSKTQSHLS